MTRHVVAARLPDLLPITSPEHPYHARRWEKNFSRLLALQSEPGWPNLPRLHPSGLGHWRHEQNAARLAGRLSTPRLNRLEALPGWCWPQSNLKWHESFDLLLCLKKLKGWPNLPRSNPILGHWISDQKHLQQRNELDAACTHKLAALPGWRWAVSYPTWEERLAELKQRKAEPGWPNLPKSEATGLGQWCAIQRRRVRQGKLSLTRIRLLSSLPGWQWFPLEKSLAVHDLV